MIDAANALNLAWMLRARIWKRHIGADGKMGKLKEFSREEADAMIAEVIFAIEEERQERDTDKIYKFLEEVGLIEKLDKKLEKELIK